MVGSKMINIPIYTNIRWRPLVATGKRNIGDGRTYNARTVEIENDDMMEPHARVDVGVSPIGILQVCLCVGDKTV